MTRTETLQMQPRTHHRLILLLGAAGAAAIAALSGGCEWDDSRTPPSAGEPGVGAPIALPSALAYVEATTGTVFLVDAPGGKPQARAVSIGRNPGVAQARLKADQLLVLTTGEEGRAGVDAEGPALWLVPAAGPPLAPIPLPTRFNALAQSPDGRFVIAYFGTAKGQGAVFNPNQIAIVDLSAPTPSAVTRSLRSIGGVPLGFEFPAAPLALGGGPRNLVIARSENYVTLIDLDNLTRGEISVPLTLSEDPSRIVPVQLVFDAGVAGLRDPTVYIRASGTSDVFALRLGPVPASEVTAVGGNDYRPSLSQLAGGSNPADMALFDAGDGPRLLVVGDRREFVVVDAASSRTLVIPIDHVARRVLVWDGPAPGEAAAKPRALLIGAFNQNQLTFVDLERLEELKTRNLETKVMVGSASAFASFPDQGLVLVQHTSNAGASIIKLGERSISPIASSLGIGAMRTNPTLPSQVWIVTKSERIGFLDLANFGVGDVRLDATVTDVVITATGGKPWLMAVHPGREGYVTAIDPMAPDRAHAQSLRGFVASGLLDRLDRSLPLDGEEQNGGAR